MIKPLSKTQRLFLAEAGRMGRKANYNNPTAQALKASGLIESRLIQPTGMKWVTTAAGDAELKRMREDRNDRNR